MSPDARRAGRLGSAYRITFTETFHVRERHQAALRRVGLGDRGRNGRTEAHDGSVRADLSVPKAMGGPGKEGTTTPEHLFAAGYAACFGGALDFVASQHKANAKGATITADVSIGPREGGGFGIAVKLRVEDKSIPTADLQRYANESHEKICPYSHATRGNVPFELEVVGA